MDYCSEVTVVLLLLSYSAGVQSCFHRQGTEGFEVLCSDTELTSLSLDQSTSILYLSGLSLQHLTEIALENCTNLAQLHLNDNVLTNASEIPFQLLKRLNYVDLSSNMFSKIDKNLFKQNSLLETLVLSGNKLSLKQEEPILISESLRKLIVSNCGIQEISSNTFSNLPKLETLYMSHNDIRLVSPLAFAETSLTFITVDETSLQALPENICKGNITIKVIGNDVMYTLNDSKLCGKKIYMYRDSSNEESTTEIRYSEPQTPPEQPSNSVKTIVVLCLANGVGLIIILILLVYYKYQGRGCNRTADIDRNEGASAAESASLTNGQH